MSRTRVLALALIAVVPLVARTDEQWRFNAKHIMPFWNTTTMYGESVLFIKSTPGTQPDASLLFLPKKITSVRNASGDITYEEGRDFIWTEGSRVVRLPEGSRIVSKTPAELRRPAGTQRHRLTHRDGIGEILFGATHEYHDMQTVITYEHSGSQWRGCTHSFAGDMLSRTVGKLKARKPVTITLLGDSISTGCNASGWAKVPPFQPPYQDLLVDKLRSAYGGPVKLKNLSVGGRDSAWGLETIDKVIESKPDLVILAFGMNDAASRPAAAFKQNSEGMIRAVCAKLPSAEFILVATMLGNGDWTYLQADLFPQYRDSLKQLCGDGVALADLTSVWTELLSRKRDSDLTGNGVNHPNDFGHRIYAQVLSALLMEAAAKRP